MICACSGCTTTRQQAGTEIGQAQARVVLPPYPSECRQTIPHAAAVLGANPVVVLVRERSQLDAANGALSRCSGFYDHLKSGLESGN